MEDNSGLGDMSNATVLRMVIVGLQLYGPCWRLYLYLGVFYILLQMAMSNVGNR